MLGLWGVKMIGKLGVRKTYRRIVNWMGYFLFLKWRDLGHILRQDETYRQDSAQIRHSLGALSQSEQKQAPSDVNGHSEESVLAFLCELEEENQHLKDRVAALERMKTTLQKRLSKKDHRTR